MWEASHLETVGPPYSSLPKASHQALTCLPTLIIPPLPCPAKSPVIGFLMPTDLLLAFNDPLHYLLVPFHVFWRARHIVTAATATVVPPRVHFLHIAF